MPPFHVEFFCPRQSDEWQTYTEGLIFKTVKYWPDLAGAARLCDSLIWQYHSACVVDSSGVVRYQV